jgi:CheY-like chemotaxis protein
VFCDPAQLDQVLLNLALNARDAMTRTGHLAFRTRHCPAALVPAGPEAPAPEGTWIELTVQDDGAGMEPETLGHVFEPFFTTKPRGSGTGLGLATVYGIVTQAQGHVTVESAPGRGSTFRIYLPHRPPPASAAEGGEVGAPAPRGRETILTVEDDPQVRAITARALRGGGYRVLEAASGAEALEVVQELEGPLHLLVTDVVMPGMDGPTLAGEVRRRLPRVRVLYVSGYPDEVISTREALEAGVQLLAKPFTPGALLARVRAVLDG